MVIQLQPWVRGRRNGFPAGARGSVIAAHISRARQLRAWRFARPVIGWFAVRLFARSAFALDPQKAITQFVHPAWTEKDGAT
jgi:hypothetical protein